MKITKRHPAAKLSERVEKLLEEDVNPGLWSHGGFAKLIGIAHHEASWLVTLSFEGPHGGSSSSVSSTLRYIEMFLREELSMPTLLVKNVSDPSWQ